MDSGIEGSARQDFPGYIPAASYTARVIPRFESLLQRLLWRASMKVTPSYLVDFMIDRRRHCRGIYTSSIPLVPETRPVRARNLLGELSLTFLFPLDLLLHVSRTFSQPPWLCRPSDLDVSRTEIVVTNWGTLVVFIQPFVRQYRGEIERKLKYVENCTLFFFYRACLLERIL